MLFTENIRLLLQLIHIADVFLDITLFLYYREQTWGLYLAVLDRVCGRDRIHWRDYQLNKANAHKLSVTSISVLPWAHPASASERFWLQNFNHKALVNTRYLWRVLHAGIVYLGPYYEKFTFCSNQVRWDPNLDLEIVTLTHL